MKRSALCLGVLVCLVCLLAVWVALADVPASTELTLNTNRNVSVSAGRETYVRFTAETAGLYTFTVNSGSEVYSTAYIALNNELTELCSKVNEDIILPFQAGETRYFGVRFGGSLNGTIGVKITLLGSMDALSLDEQKTAVVEADNLAYFTFTPEQTGNYVFHSVSEEDTFGYQFTLANGELTQIAYDDDSGDGNNFQLVFRLNAGETRYFGVRYYHSSTSGSFPVIIENYDRLISSPEGEDLENNGSEWVKHQIYGQSSVLTVGASSRLGEVTWTWMRREDDGLLVPAEGAADGNLTVPADITHSVQYVCFVSDGIDQDEHRFIVYPEDSIEQLEPENGQHTLNVLPGGSADMAVTAVSTSGLHTYQWYQKKYMDDGTGNMIEYWDPIPGADQAAYSAKNVLKYSQYKCRVDIPIGDPKDVWFEVGIDFNLTVSPIGDTEICVPAGSSATLKVQTEPAGTPVTYQWYREGVLIENAETSSCTISNIQRGATYRCRVLDDYGHDENVYFHVSIKNNVSAWAYSWEDNPCVEYGDECTLYVHTSSDDENEVFTFQWYGPANEAGGTANAISGATGSEYTIPRVTRGGYYYCIVRNKENFRDRVEFHVMVDNGLNAYADNQYVDTYAGEEVELSVLTECYNGNTTFQWYGPVADEESLEDAARIPGATDATYKVKQWTSSRDIYQCVVTDQYGNTETVPFYVSIYSDLYADAENDEYWFTAGYGQTVELAVDASAYGQISYQWYRKTKTSENLYVWSILNNETDMALTVRFVTENENYLCIVEDQIGEQVRVEFEISMDNEFSVDNFGDQHLDVTADQPVILTANASHIGGEFSYQWYAEEKDDYGNTAMRKMDGETDSSVEISDHLFNNRRFFCRVTDATGEQLDTHTYHIWVDNGFSAWADESDLTADPGASVTMTVLTTSYDMNITYQWYRDDNLVPGVTGNTCTMDPADSNASYRCHAQDRYGNSQDVRFIIRIDSGLTASAEQSNLLTVSGAGAMMKVNVSCKNGTVVSYRWYKDSGYENGQWHDEEEIEGVTGPACPSGPVVADWRYYCIVSDQFGAEKQVDFSIEICDLEDLTVLYLPEETVIIEEEAFAGTDCQAVIIPDGCTTIGRRAFADCEQLLYVQVPASVTALAEDAFEGCALVMVDDRRSGE